MENEFGKHLICPSCGEVIEEENPEFCPRCGVKLNEVNLFEPALSESPQPVRQSGQPVQPIIQSPIPVHSSPSTPTVQKETPPTPRVVGAREGGSLKRSLLQWGGFVVIAIIIDLVVGPMGIPDSFIIGVVIAIIYLPIFSILYKEKSETPAQPSTSPTPQGRKEEYVYTCTNCGSDLTRTASADNMVTWKCKKCGKEYAVTNEEEQRDGVAD